MGQFTDHPGEGYTMSTEQPAPIYIPLSQWAFIASGILALAIPWWLGLLWIVGLLS